MDERILSRQSVMPDSIRALNFGSSKGNIEKQMDLKKKKVKVLRLTDILRMENNGEEGVKVIPRFL